MSKPVREPNGFATFTHPLSGEVRLPLAQNDEKDFILIARSSDEEGVVRAFGSLERQICADLCIPRFGDVGFFYIKSIAETIAHIHPEVRVVVIPWRPLLNINAWYQARLKSLEVTV